jgi:hypothetical protein
MIGRNPLWVAKQHGQSITMMLSVQIQYSFHPKLSIRALAGGHELGAVSGARLGLPGNIGRVIAATAALADLRRRQPLNGIESSYSGFLSQRPHG